MDNQKIIDRSKINNKYNGGMVERPSALDIAAKIIVTFLLVVVLFVCLIPIWHVLMASFSDGRALQAHSGVAWLPVGGFNLGGYALTFEYEGILTGYGNTLIYVVVGTLLGVVVDVIAGYVMSRKSMLQKFFIVYILITMMFSGGMVSTFMVVRSLGLVGSRLSIILPTSVNAVYIILMMNAYRGVDNSFVEAAEIDGAGHFRIMFQVMLPQCLNMAFVIILFTVVQQWNSWMEASMYLPTDRELWPLQLWIKEISAQSADWGQTANPDYNRSLIEYCVIVISLVPIIVIATVFQKWIEKGVLIGGVKE